MSGKRPFGGVFFWFFYIYKTLTLTLTLASFIYIWRPEPEPEPEPEARARAVLVPELKPELEPKNLNRPVFIFARGRAGGFWFRHLINMIKAGFNNIYLYKK